VFNHTGMVTEMIIEKKPQKFIDIVKKK
jgi:hypothetical protein